MIGLRYFDKSCLQESANPLSLVAEPEADSELKQIRDKLGHNCVVVAPGDKISTLVRCHLTREHTSVDLIGHGGGTHIRIGQLDNTKIDRFDEVATEMQKGQNTLLRLLACKQAFLPVTRRELTRIAETRLAKRRVYLGVAGGYVVADQFSDRRFESDPCTTVSILPKLAAALFSGLPPQALTFDQQSDEWTGSPERQALAHCLLVKAPTLALDKEDTKRVLSLPRVRVPGILAPADFVVMLPSAVDQNAMLAFGHMQTDETALLVPQLPTGAPADYAIELSNRGNTFLFNKETVTLYWR